MILYSIDPYACIVHLLNVAASMHKRPEATFIASTGLLAQPPRFVITALLYLASLPSRPCLCESNQLIKVVLSAAGRDFATSIRREKGYLTIAA
jgi:hypothetical protein